MMAGLCVNISAKLFLNRSFGIVAANRGIKRGGPYRLVRHPMYFGSILTQVGFVLASFKLTTLALYLVAWTFQTGASRRRKILTRTQATGLMRLK